MTTDRIFVKFWFFYPQYAVIEIEMTVFHDEIEIEDFEYDEELELYHYPCPCGDRFEISKVCTIFTILEA